ncbi:acyltransferase family protein [Nocardioides sp. R-C-SC26]|uniref:acyltransferase family protein n=1 Tax=Nocardioides sp. R-C-SC26 TaxID=2870414 RepID=UPI001E489696|nr:acyltransferase family protein [Nocardioides sp. R-C-SC26]
MASRDPWLDNAKMALVTLVVVGHGWILLPSGALTDQWYHFVYFWHMPAFVFVTGYLSRTFDYSRGRLWALVRSVLVPYLLFECALVLFRTYVGDETISDVFLDPHWPVWYLVAVFCWRLMTPVFRALPPVVAVGSAVAISLAAGYLSFEYAVYFDLARVLGFLPFFVLGLVATRERLAVLERSAAAVVGVVVLATAFVAARFLDGWAGRDWLYYRSYDVVDASGLDAAATRASLLLIGIACAFAFLTLVPRAEGWFTRMGAATLVVYLFHGFAVRGAEYAGFDEWAQTAVVPAALAIVAAGIACSFLLAAPPIARRLERVADPLAYAQEQAVQAVDLSMAVVEHEQAPIRPPLGATPDHVDLSDRERVPHGTSAPRR